MQESYKMNYVLLPVPAEVLDELELELSQYGFVRAHQSFLVNMRYIDKISSYVLRLITGKEISVPKARYQEVKRSFALYKGAV